MGLRCKQVQFNVNTGGATTTVSNFFPANAMAHVLQLRVTTTISNGAHVTDIDDAESGTANIYFHNGGDNEFEAAGSTMNVGNGTANYVYHQASNMVITHAGTPSAGAIRAILWYWDLTAPTS